jgi:outer membrane protein OmpA-like peptidoglycan-associated protein
MSYTPWFPKLAAIGALALLLAGSVTPAEAQFGRRLKEAVKRTAEDKAIQKVTEEESAAIDSALEGGEAARPADSATVPGEGAAAAPVGAGANAAAGPSAEPAAAKPGEGVWANYDFKPGERVIFSEDFTKDEVGDFPRRIELKEGNMEVVEWQGGRFLRATSYGGFELPLSEPLPERFTLEFDFTGAGSTGWPMYVYFSAESERPAYVQVGPYEGGIAGGDSRSVSSTTKDLTGTVFPVRVMVDGSYGKVYIGDKRVGNLPNAKLGRSNKILFKIAADEKNPVFISNIRVAAGGKKLYDALAEKGRVSTQGIYFDTGSDRIRPESSGTLKEIGTMLKEHPELKLTIEGHTDNVGSAATNQTLSDKRAAAVRQALVDTYQVDAARLQAKGLGSTKPTAPNDTPEGRQQNRRVELVKS